MSFVGMDIDKCSQLKVHLDQAAADLRAHADRVAALLAQAGIGSSNAPAEIRDVAAWADYRSRDLQKRIERMIAANGGSGPGFRFASPEISRKAAKQQADTLKKLMQGGDAAGVADALAKVKTYAGDPVFAAALLHALGTSRLLQLLRGAVDGDSTGIAMPPAALAPLAALLATVARANPHDKVINDVLDNASPAELVALLKFGGFGPDFVGRAAVTILKYSPYQAGPMDTKLADARQYAINALKADPAAAKAFFDHADDLAIMSLLRDPDPTHIALLAQAGPALDRMLALIAKDGEISAAAKQELATLLVPAFLDQRIVNVIPNKDPSLGVSSEQLIGALAVLMSDDAARKTIFDAAGAQLAKSVAHTVPRMLAHDGEFVTNAGQDAFVGGTTIGIVQKAYAKRLGDDAKAAEAEAEILKTAGHILGGLILKGAPPGVDAIAMSQLDHFIDADANAAGARLAAAGQTGPLSNARAQIAAAVAQVLVQDPSYRSSLEQFGLIKQGHLVDITNASHEERRLNDWIAAQPGLEDKIRALELQFGHWMGQV